ncbi:MAG: ABC transporter permease [Bdellovibrio sp. CG10_big_fil_rev_8_21_14_0_10_47_8]|nr:MAG: ABC transporter permease [Bdellovibrio sp. CG10_big_fil_rev_8_21_14_0_10_47_8]
MAIGKKEIKGFYLSPNFYVVCFLCAAIFSWVYPNVLNKFAMALQTAVYQPDMPKQQLNIHYQVFLPQLNILNLILIFVVPALTMRLFAEEKKLHTFDLLLTSPVTSAQIVAGKYLAALSAIFGLCFLSFLYPAATTVFAHLNWAPLIIAFLGIFIVGAVYAAMDIFASSLTESAVVAYVLAVIFNMAVWFVGIGVDVVDSPLARQIFEHISLNQHLMALVEGTIRTNSLIFLGSLIFLFCFLCERVVESSRWR